MLVPNLPDFYPLAWLLSWAALSLQACMATWPVAWTVGERTLLYLLRYYRICWLLAPTSTFDMKQSVPATFWQSYCSDEKKQPLSKEMSDKWQKDGKMNIQAWQSRNKIYVLREGVGYSGEILSTIPEVKRRNYEEKINRLFWPN